MGGNILKLQLEGSVACTGDIWGKYSNGTQENMYGSEIDVYMYKCMYYMYIGSALSSKINRRKDAVEKAIDGAWL